MATVRRNLTRTGRTNYGKGGMLRTNLVGGPLGTKWRERLKQIREMMDMRKSMTRAEIRSFLVKGVQNNKRRSGSNVSGGQQPSFKTRKSNTKIQKASPALKTTRRNMDG